MRPQGFHYAIRSMLENVDGLKCGIQIEETIKHTHPFKREKSDAITFQNSIGFLSTQYMQLIVDLYIRACFVFSVLKYIFYIANIFFLSYYLYYIPASIFRVLCCSTYLLCSFCIFFMLLLFFMSQIVLLSFCYSLHVSSTFIFLL